MVGFLVLLILAVVLVAYFASRSQRSGAVETALKCPHCGTANVELAVKVGYIRGFLLMCRYGSSLVVGCRACVRSQTLSAAGRTLALGWWCYPWGLATPFVVLQNLSQLLVSPPGLLDEALHRVGIRLDDVVVDASGLTAEQRALVASVAAVTARLMIVGPREQVRRAGASCVLSIGAGRVSEDEVFARIDAGLAHSVSSATFDAETRRSLLEVAVKIAASVGPPSAAMLMALDQIAAELGFDPATVRRMAGIGFEDANQRDTAEPSSSLRAAATVLGVAPDASALELRARYRELMLKYHPDHAEAAGMDVAEATRQTQKINEAYHLLIEMHAAHV
jgi:DnaJ-domain-containing protein 1